MEELDLSKACVKCGFDQVVKNGIIKGLQRFKCKNCGYNFTVEHKSTGVSEHTKRIALMMYLEGERISAIARKLNVTHVAVIKWLEKTDKDRKQKKVTA